MTPNTANAFDYTLFGLHIRSELRLPELLAADSGSAPDVTIALGDVAAGTDPDRETQAIAGGVLLTIAGIARYAVTDGARIVLDRQPEVPEVNIRLYLLGSAMGALLHQRGLLPLHANAVAIDGGGFAFMGASGAGKSTLAAWFHDHGFPIIADDVCAVRFDGDRPLVQPGLPRLRLWKEALEASGRDTGDFSRSFAGDDDWDKYDVPLAPSQAVRAEVALAAIYLLGEEGPPDIVQIDGMAAAEAIFANTYRGAMVPMTNSSREHWSACVKLVRTTPIYTIRRQWGAAQFDAQCALALSHARTVAAQVNGVGSRDCDIAGDFIE